MAEMGEVGGVGVISDFKWDCPFPHEKAKWDECENNFLGEGKDLGDKMEAATQTIVLKKRQEAKVEKSLRPAKDKQCEGLHNKPRPIRLFDKTVLPLPLTCAAHHLIPAQAALRQAKSFNIYLYKGEAKFYQRVVADKKAKTKKREATSTGGGKLIENVGYDVNGLQNGLWLPGPYALWPKKTDGKPVPKSKRPMAGLKAQEAEISDDDPDGEDFVEKEGDTADTPTGSTLTVDYYTLYTAIAMQKVPGQYHDAHPEYSEFVLNELEALGDLFFQSDVLGMCDACNEANLKKDGKLPPPYKVLGWLNHISGRLRTFLQFPPDGWKMPLYTSKYSLEFWKNRKDGSMELSVIERPS